MHTERRLELQGKTDGEANIVLKNVTKRFGEVTSLDNLSLEIQDRELLVLLGPSGCGKSTTLNLLAGLEQPTEGEIYFGERLMNGIPAEKRDVSMVFQTIGLYPHLNVLDNITFPLRLQKVAPDVIGKRVDEMVEILGISNLLERRLIELSGGERQRVSIAKALIKRPTLFLLDEPFSSLDADRRRQLRSDLVRIHRRLDTTMVFVTHDQEEAMSVADRIVVMSAAKLQQVGSPLDIHNAPTNLWVAQFIGAQPINVVDAYWQPGVATARLFAEDGPQVDLDSGFGEKLQARDVDSAFILGVRPEFLSVKPANGESGGIRGEVYTRQVLGNHILYHIQADGHELRAVTPAQYRLELGQPVAVEFDWSHSFVFDRDSQQCLIS